MFFTCVQWIYLDNFLAHFNRVYLISPPLGRGICVARELPLHVFIFCSWGVINSVNGVSVWWMKLVLYLHLFLAERAHFQTNLLPRNAPSIAVCFNSRSCRSPEMTIAVPTLRTGIWYSDIYIFRGLLHLRVFIVQETSHTRNLQLTVSRKFFSEGWLSD